MIVKMKQQGQRFLMHAPICAVSLSCYNFSPLSHGRETFSIHLYCNLL